MISREQIQRDNVDLVQALTEALRRLGTAGNTDLVDILDRVTRVHEKGQ